MDTADQHYEEKFEFPLWKMIKTHAAKKDISYVKAALEVLPEFEKGIRYRDTKFEEAEVGKRAAELRALQEADRKNRPPGGPGGPSGPGGPGGPQGGPQGAPKK